MPCHAMHACHHCFAGGHVHGHHVKSCVHIQVDPDGNIALVPIISEAFLPDVRCNGTVRGPDRFSDPCSGFLSGCLHVNDAYLLCYNESSTGANMAAHHKAQQYSIFCSPTQGTQEKEEHIAAPFGRQAVYLVSVSS